MLLLQINTGRNTKVVGMLCSQATSVCDKGFCEDPCILKADCQFCNCIPGRKSGILRIQYGHAAAADFLSDVIT